MTAPLLKLDGVQQGGGRGQPRLHSLSITLGVAEKVAVLGGNGAGKTTLLRLVAGLLAPSLGSARLGQLDLQSPKDRKQAPRIAGLVFAHTDDQLLQPTVREEIALGPLNLGKNPQEVGLLTQELLERFHLENLAEASPFSLSSGEKKRLALASIMAMEPQLLLLDEPTHYLDRRGKQNLALTLQQWKGALLVATHDPLFAQPFCTRVWVMDGGTIIADTNWDELRQKASFLEAHNIDPIP